MERWQRLYLFGMGWICFLVILGELVWLPDPIRLGHQLFWIDVINFIAYLLLLVPLLWALSAIWGIVEARKSYRIDQTGVNGAKVEAMVYPAEVRGTKIYGLAHLRSLYWAILRRSGIIVLSGLAFIYIITEQLQLLAGSLGAAWLLVLVDIAISERRRIRRVPWHSLTIFAVSLVLLATLFWPMPYMVTYPGLTINMNRYANAEGGVPHGQISGVLVFERPAVPADWLYARLFPHYSFERREKLGMSLGAYDNLVRVMKLDANAMGSAVAFRELGIGQGIKGLGAKVLKVMEGSAAEGSLLSGDIIVALNGHAVSSAQDLTTHMGAVHPGDEVSLTLLRSGKRVSLTSKTKENPSDPKRAALGIQITDEVQPDLPLKVVFHQYLAHEGGPSHGAILALTLIDQLTPGGITYGNNVAGTGTINADGSVGQIGGIEQKAYSVNRAGADVFFVPAGQELEAKQGSADLRIVPVKTIDDMLKWLKAHPKVPG